MVDYYDKYDDLIETRLETEKPSEVNVKPSLSSDGKASAIVLTRRCTRLNDENGAIIYKRIPGTQVMQIYSKELIEALQGIVDVRTVGAAGQESLRLREPFEQVVRNLSSLQQKASQSENQTLKEQFELLSGVLHELYPKLERERALHGGSPAHCTHDMLWLLVDRDQDVIERSSEGYRAFVVHDFEMVAQTKGIMHFKLKLWYMDFDGKDFGRARLDPVADVTIVPFQGTREITSLPATQCNITQLRVVTRNSAPI